MAKINIRGAKELYRFVVYNKRRCLVRSYLVRTDGSVLRRSMDRWVVYRTKGDMALVDRWVQKMRDHEDLEVFMGKSEPTYDTRRRWLNKGTSKAIDGCKVAVRRCCEHGYPCWLMATYMVVD